MAIQVQLERKFKGVTENISPLTSINTVYGENNKPLEEILQEKVDKTELITIVNELNELKEQIQEQTRTNEAQQIQIDQNTEINITQGEAIEREEAELTPEQLKQLTQDVFGE